jgi:glutathione S-transferase
MTLALWYWPGDPGRGEYIRLPLEAGGIAYTEPAREAGDDFDAVVQHLSKLDRHPAFAVPLLQAGAEAIAQTPNILNYLVEEHGLGPSDPAARRYLNQLQCDIADMTAEVHDVHHPIATSLYYEDQRDEAVKAAETFRKERIPKYLGHLEKAAQASGSSWLVGDRWSTGDTSITYVFDGLEYMFPKHMARVIGDYPKLLAIREQVRALPGVADYLASDRRQAFTLNGIFRAYPELDAR